MAAPRKYPLELRERAVRLWRSEQPRRPIAHVARELGIHPEVLRSWIRRGQADQASAPTWRTQPSVRSCSGCASGWWSWNAPMRS
jgi:transposase-like protein